MSMKNTGLRRRTLELTNALEQWEEVYHYTRGLDEAAEIMQRLMRQVMDLQDKVNTQAVHIKLQDEKLRGYEQQAKR